MATRKNAETTEETASTEATIAAVDVEAVETAAAEGITTEDATTAEDVAALAFQGKPLPTGWSFNPKRGYFRNEEG